MHAAYAGRTELVELLLTRGAPVTVRVLLRHGADMNVRTDFGAPLDLVRRRGNPTLERVLQQARASIRREGRVGRLTKGANGCGAAAAVLGRL